MVRTISLTLAICESLDICVYSECDLKDADSRLAGELAGEVSFLAAIKFDHLMAAVTLRDSLADFERLQSGCPAVSRRVGVDLLSIRPECGLVGDRVQIGPSIAANTLQTVQPTAGRYSLGRSSGSAGGARDLAATIGAVRPRLHVDHPALRPRAVTGLRSARRAMDPSNLRSSLRKSLAFAKSFAKLSSFVIHPSFSFGFTLVIADVHPRQPAETDKSCPRSTGSITRPNLKRLDRLIVRALEDKRRRTARSSRGRRVASRP